MSPSTLKRINTVMEARLGRVAKATDTIDELGIDSLDALDLQFYLEDEFQIEEIPTAMFTPSLTMEELGDEIEKLMRQRRSA